ncbi:MAG: LPXTG cell wall anchor domain-containing protein, partial [Anaerotignum sp.]|nr:LPXTG cell wall anchor domain-containing protein [Anaerotignum sp.]
VSVVDAAGNILASGRVAGENKEDEDYKTLEADENGNYTFSNIVMTEGEQNFNITLEGIQNLEQGVYLYTSEVRGTTSSQTMVGMAEGEHAVDVSMNIKFELSVDDEVVATERISRSKISQNDPETTPEEPIIEELGEIEEPDVPLTDLPEAPADTEEPVVDIAEGDVPLADAPEEPLVAGEEEIIAETGDSNHMAAGFAGMLAALAGMVGLRRRKED